MALTLAVGTNTYITLADAETYVERLYGPRRTAWDAATDATKNQLLAQATLEIDMHLWRGYKTDSDQTLEFPRNGDATTDTAYTKVEQATVEQALHILSYCSEKRAVLANMGVKSFKLGALSETYAGGQLPILAPRAKVLLREWYLIGAAFA